MLRLTAARTTFGALALVVTAGLVSATPAASAAPGSGETGSIIYDRGGDVYQTTPAGSGTHRVTTDGSTPTADKTGSTGYAVPTESDDGLIAAVRNQDYGGYSQGFVWVMDRNGKVIDKFKPPQFSLLPQVDGCSGPDAQLPQGIVNASISPDGKHIAYTASAIGNNASCQALSEVGSWIADIDGSHGHWLSAGPSATADLEIGRWVRVWSTTGYGSAPTAECEYASVAHPGTIHDNLNQPSLSPDGTEVVYEDYDDPAADASNEGIYIAPAAGALASAQACTNANPSLFVQGAEDPFWTPASTARLPSDTTPPTATLTAPNHAATTGSSVKLTWTGHDDYSGIAYYQLRQQMASYSAGFSSWSTPSSWQHLISKSATRSGLGRGNDYCFELRAVDNAGNMSTWTAPRCTAVPLDDRSLGRSTGWTTATGRAFYAGTVTSTTKKGATLTRTNAEVDRIAVIATTGPQCGSVNVYVGAHRLGTLNLHGSRTKHQVVKSLPTFSARSGTVKLTVTTAGKTVAIDGLLLSRT